MIVSSLQNLIIVMYAQKIKEIRKNLGLSVPKLAERINIPARTIVSYESGP